MLVLLSRLLVDLLLLCIVVLAVALRSYLFVSFVVLVEFNIASACVNCSYRLFRNRGCHICIETCLFSALV